MGKRNVTSIRVGENTEVMVEDLLMKLALAETVILGMSQYIETIDVNHGTCPNNVDPPDSWAVSGALQNVGEVSHALKSACWGYEEAYRH